MTKGQMIGNEVDREFLRAFEECTLGKTCWSHSAHIRMAWLQLERYGSFKKALEAIRSGIMRYNSSVGSIGYHETVTVAFTRLIHHRRLLADHEPRSWQHFLELNTDLLSKEHPVLESYYTKDRLMSDEARTIFVESDLKALPLNGDVRFATEDDAAQIAAIYAPYVQYTPISFEINIPSEGEFRRRMRENLQVAPWLVYEVDGEIAGYAYGTKHREREAYKWSADVSAYIAEKYQKRGIGRVLYTKLLRFLCEMGYHNAFAGITLPNPASIGLHEAMGFEPIGVYRSVGFKHDKWHDVGWWQKVLKSPDRPPKTITKVSEISLAPNFAEESLNA